MSVRSQSVRNQEKQIRKKEKSQKIKLVIAFTFYFLPFTFFNIKPAIAATQSPILTIVQSQENTNQWTGITNRLQGSGVKYCVISLTNVKSAADWGDRQVLFLPNVDTLTPAQAIALEEWMSKGGRLIASGPVGTLSAPGVRQLLQTLLGGYWGFSLNDAQQLQPAKNNLQNWANQNGLFGKVRGGVVVADNVNSEAAAVWNSKDNPAAVVATKRSTFFGWRWGVDTASSPELDTAWLKAAVNRHVKETANTSNKIEGGSPNCSTSVALATPVETFRRNVSTPLAPPTFFPAPRTATAPQSRPIPNVNPPKSEEAIDQLEQAVRLDVVPNSNAPISNSDAIALQQELQNLIGRVDSANLTANAIDNNPQIVKQAQSTQVASTRPGVPISTTEQARNIAKNLPQLIAQQKYAEARQQWIQAKGNLWQQFPIDRQLAQPEIRAVWLDRGTIVRAKNEQGLAEIFDRLSKAGINTIFFETVNAGYTIYPSQVAPQQNPLIRGWDPLAAAVKLAHERHMELHAWVWTFAAGNQRHNEVIKAPANYPGPVLAAHPDWANYDNRGNMIPPGQTKPFFDPANPELRQYLLRLYEEIVTRYDVDGLQLDYIRYPFQDPAAGRIYGYGKAARAQFQQLNGVDPISISPSQRDLWQKWTRFRTQQVDGFVAQASQQLRQKRPNLIVSVAVFPLPELERIQKIQQHWEVWARQGDIDLIIPMTYALDTPRFQRLAQPWIASTKLGSTLLVPGIRLLSLPIIGAFDQIQVIRDLPASGYALFAAENLTNELQKVFGNTQSSIGQGEIIPHRQPFKTAAVRYTALQREWKFVLQNEQLRLPQTTLSTFNSQTEILQNALDQLSAAPSASKLIAARATFTRFQFQFRIWMRQENIDNPYQVRAWENRLATIERLLRYGERVELRR
ncbi:MAG: family 10 glycosylhydrolase [Tolypothrix brevis GSE-NOS-MK-07-07A]|jgi:uncharacterized lipoprotein YddW (UPF0748 family)|nr:family 10 glycosylhydrolase [Tolypothrix brevis GSE-NOS-MK-07-07A]